MGKIPLRKNVKIQDTWDLTKLCESDEKWEERAEKIRKVIPEAKQFEGKLVKNVESLENGLSWKNKLFLELESLGNYAFLKVCADGSDSSNQRRMGVISQIFSEAESAISFFEPEILESSEVETWIESPILKDNKIYLQKLLKFKAHTLSQKEEKILAMQGELQTTVSDVYQDLSNMDMKFGEIDGKPLTQSTFSSFLINPDREIRKKAYLQYYKTYDSLKNTIAKLYSGSIKQDCFNAKVRNFDSSLKAALFPDNVPENVYTNLINTIHEAFPILHRYYDLKKKALGVDRLAHWDVYAPMVKEVSMHTTYDEAVNTIEKALQPLGKEYVETLVNGLTRDRWVDRYENEGKRSGAFSSGTYNGFPHILLSYKEDVIHDIFTLAHEGGHSMHSYYSVRNNPFSCYDYTIFEAEVASTFNEQLLFHYMIENTKDKQMKAYLIANQLDSMIGTLFRQTMFAEFELLCHQQVENKEPLTVESFKSIYKKLLVNYFSENVEFTETSDLEGLRIPHFYRAFYVYKYSTGICASIALSERVLNGGKKELDDYLGFLKRGGSKYPIENLKKAGVDMSSPEPIRKALKKFENLLNEFETLV